MQPRNPASQAEASVLFAHRVNIERYEKILQTCLTEYQRAFVQRRLAEERAALRHLGRRAALQRFSRRPALIQTG